MRLTIEELAGKLEELLDQPEALVTLGELLEDAQPFDLAEALGSLSEEQALQVLAAVTHPFAAEVLEHLEYIDQYRLLHHMDQQLAPKILDQMNSDAVADLVGAVHPRQAEQLLKLMPPEYVTTIRRLIEYPENSAAGRMTIDYISVRQYMTAEQVLTHIRKVGSEAETVAYIYVVDAPGRLVGVISLRELILASPKERVLTFMNGQVVSVPATMDQEEVARIVSQYDLIAVPVVDHDNRLMGIITVDDIIDVLQEEATEDVYRMAATSVPEEITGNFVQTVWSMAKPRLPWIIGLLFMEMGTGLIMDSFSGLVSPSVAAMLGMFTIVMAGESGNAATQALAVVVRGLATGEIRDEDIPRIVAREASIGLLIGVCAGTVLTLIGWLWQDHFLFGLSIGLALAVNLFIAKVVGSLFPVIIHRLGIDPAVASGPLITSLTDNSSMFIYYGIAALVMRTVGV